MIAVYDIKKHFADHYIVIIDGDSYSMSADAHTPNGVCMYYDTAEEALDDVKPLKPLSPLEVPEGVWRTIKRIVARNYLEETKDARYCKGG